MPQLITPLILNPPPPKNLPVKPKVNTLSPEGIQEPSLEPGQLPIGAEDMLFDPPQIEQVDPDGYETDPDQLVNPVYPPDGEDLRQDGEFFPEEEQP